MAEKKDVYLPKHMKAQADHFAKIHCMIEGLENSESKDYKDAYKKAFHDFCYEAYMHSLTPSGELSSNPYSPRLSAKYFINFLIYINDMKPGVSQEELERIKLRHRAAVTSLTHNFFELKGYNVKRPKGTGESHFEHGSGKQKHSNKYQKVRNQYHRMFIASLIMGAIKNIYTNPDIENVDKMIKDHVAGFSESWTPEKKYKKLHDPETRINFIESVLKSITTLPHLPGKDEGTQRTLFTLTDSEKKKTKIIKSLDDLNILAKSELGLEDVDIYKGRLTDTAVAGNKEVYYMNSTKYVEMSEVPILHEGKPITNLRKPLASKTKWMKAIRNTYDDFIRGLGKE